MSAADLHRITMASDLHDELSPEDPWDIDFRFDESNWSRGTVSRRMWLQDEYVRAYGTRRPWQLPGSTRTRSQWVQQDFARSFSNEERALYAQDTKAWMDFKPSNRYGDSARSALLPEPPTEPPPKATTATPEGESGAGEGAVHTTSTSTGEPVRSGIAGFLKDGGPKGQDFAEAVTQIRTEQDSFVDSNGTQGTGTQATATQEVESGDSLFSTKKVAPGVEMAEFDTTAEEGTGTGTGTTDHRIRGFQTEEGEGKFTILDSDDDASFVDSDVEADDAVDVEESRVEGQVVRDGDSRVVEPQAVEPLQDRNDINSPVTQKDLDDLAMEAEPYGLDRPAAMDQRSFWGKFKDTLFRRKTGGLSEPLLQGQEMVQLGDRPTALELAPDLEAPTIDAFDGVVKYMESPEGGSMSKAAMAQELGIGVGSNGGLWIQGATLKEWTYKQLNNVKLAPMIAPLTMWLNEVSPVAGNYLNIGMAGMDLLTTGDPFALLLLGAGQLWAETGRVRQRVISNDHPDKEYGSRYGYVREGDKWYPALYKDRFMSTGMGAHDGNMTMTYGSEIVNFLDGESNWLPAVVDGVDKKFTVQDHELDKTVSQTGAQFDSKEFLDERQVTRNWYFLSPEDMASVRDGSKSFDSYINDNSKFNPAQVEFNDWRKAMDIGQDWKWSSAVSTIGVNATVNDYDGSAGLDRTLREIDNTKLGWDDSWEAGKTMTQDEWVQQAADAKGSTLWEPTLRPASNYMFDTILRDHLDKLYKTQRLAAQESGFDKTYQSQLGKVFEDTTDAKRAATGRREEGATVWSSMYLDTGKDMPVAADANALAQQMQDIEMYTDRTALQRNYLAQKAQTRYWMQQVSNQGGSTDLMHYLYGRDTFAENPWGTRNMTLQSLDEYSEYTADYTGVDSEYMGKILEDISDPLWRVQHPDIGSMKMPYNKWDQAHLANMPGWVAPWQNANEGLLPTLTGALAGRNYTDLMDDYRGEAYTRMSGEANARARDWVRRTGKVDPNLKILGVERDMENRNLTQSVDDPHGRLDDPFDEGIHTYVKPGENSPGTFYNPVTGDYELTEDEQKRRDDAEAAQAAQGQDKDKDGKAVATQEEEQQERSAHEHKTTQDVSMLESGMGDVDDEFLDDFLRDRHGLDKPEEWRKAEKLPGADETDFLKTRKGGLWDNELPPGFYMDAGPYGQAHIFFNGKMVPGTPSGTPEGTEGAMRYWIDRAEQAEADTQAEADKTRKAEAEAEAEQAQAEAEQSQADTAAAAAAKLRRHQEWVAEQEEADATRQARWAERDARYADFKHADRTKGDIAAQKEHFAAEEEWRKTGVELGFLPAGGGPPVNSHGFDPVQHHTHVHSVPLPASVDHEEHHFVPMSTAFHNAIAALEAGPSASPPPQHVKVV